MKQNTYSTLLRRAKSMRSLQTKAEERLWYYLRDRRLKGFKFRRQVVIGNYIVDFICPDKKIIVEVDGGQHATQEKYDQKRTIFLESKGYKVLRFWNNEVLANSDSVLDVILLAVL